MYANKKSAFWANWLKAGEYAIDVVTTLSGVGNILKFGRLYKVFQAGKNLAGSTKTFTKVVTGIKGTAGVAEITSGSVNILLKLTGIADTDLGREISKYLFYFEIAALSGEISLALYKKIQSSASKILAKEKVLRESAENAEEVKQIDDLVEELYKFFDIIRASKIIYKEVKTLEKIYTQGSKADFEKGVKYLDEVERKEFEVFVQHDRIIDKNGKLFDTNGSVEIIGKDKFESNKAIYVMSEKGEIFISKQNEIGKFHHSSFLSGEKVAAAGDIVIEKGIIKQISNHSGHYRPTIEQVKRNLLKELNERSYFSTGLNKEENIKFITGF